MNKFIELLLVTEYVDDATFRRKINPTSEFCFVNEM